MKRDHDPVDPQTSDAINAPASARENLCSSAGGRSGGFRVAGGGVSSAPPGSRYEAPIQHADNLTPHTRTGKIMFMRHALMMTAFQH
jgi:hypothetical protein